MKLKVLCLSLLFYATSFGQEPSAQKIMLAVTELMSPMNVYSVGTQTITTSSGTQRTFEFESWSSNKGEKSLTRYTKPAAIRGQAFLMLNNADDIWTYFPRTKRVRKLASHAKKQKVQGSDFTYEDMGGGDTFLTKFQSSYLGQVNKDGVIIHQVELTGIPSQDPPYPKMILWARESDYFPIQIDYFDETDFNLKTLVLSDVQLIEDFPTAMKMEMTDHRERSTTIMETLSATYKWEPPGNFFSERSLKK